MVYKASQVLTKTVIRAEENLDWHCFFGKKTAAISETYATNLLFS